MKTMGVCEEDRESEHVVMKMKKEKTGYSKYKRKRLVTHFRKNAERCVIAGLITMIIGLIVALIVSKYSKYNNSVPCVDDWIWYRGKCYYFSNKSDTWNNSEKFCNSHKSSLAIIENKEEKDFLFRYKGTDNHWIGIRRTDDNTAWTWTNGSLYNESLFRITRSSEHSGEIEYVFLNHEGVRSQEGVHEFKWICNKK
ncbi:C-type lectin domain family 2 member A-like isoform X2 [Phyllobates terribilis]|uniref:C-type lectin domain family 2 member A-like isoform X2 n=1 Tax=Phyllobates terribilis TaxID=111132 RepID=UPI003CCB1252